MPTAAEAMKLAAEEVLTRKARGERTRESEDILRSRMNPLTGQIDPLWMPPDPPGFKLAYITERINGQVAEDNLRLMSQRGWQPCTYEEFGYKDPIHAMPGLEERSDGFWRVGGMLLCKLPADMYDAYAVRAPVLQADKRHNAFRRSALPRQRPDGEYNTDDPEFMDRPEEQVEIRSGSRKRRGEFAQD